MTDLQRWALREAGGNPYEEGHGDRVNDFARGAERFAEMLMSDDALDAATRDKYTQSQWELMSSRGKAFQRVVMRDSIQAAISAVASKGYTDE